MKRAAGDSFDAQGGQRVASVDALRGFDMLWIVGADSVVYELAKVKHTRAVSAVREQMDHQPWEGFHFYDLIFPLFVFIVGVSLVFSLTRRLASAERSKVIWRIVLRSAVLYLLGIIVYGGFSKHYGDVRLLGVLQRIAICYLCAATLFCFFRPGVLLGVGVGLLAVYWAIMSFVPAPGIGRSFGHVSFKEGQNVANYVDAQYLPGRKWDGDHDPEGLLSTLPAIATCLAGVFAGLLLMNGTIAPGQKVLCLLAAGAVSVALGTFWGMQFPVIKKLWTSSFVLVAGGYSAMLLGIFYLVIDVWKLQTWARPFVWVGGNAITLYLLTELYSFKELARRFIGGDFEKQVFHQYGELAIGILALLMVLALARFLYVRKIFLRV